MINGSRFLRYSCRCALPLVGFNGQLIGDISLHVYIFLYVVVKGSFDSFFLWVGGGGVWLYLLGSRLNTVAVRQEQSFWNLKDLNWPRLRLQPGQKLMQHCLLLGVKTGVTR